MAADGRRVLLIPVDETYTAEQAIKAQQQLEALLPGYRVRLLPGGRGGPTVLPEPPVHWPDGMETR